MKAMWQRAVMASIESARCIADDLTEAELSAKEKLRASRSPTSRKSSRVRRDRERRRCRGGREPQGRRSTASAARHSADQRAQRGVPPWGWSFSLVARRARRTRPGSRRVGKPSRRMKRRCARAARTTSTSTRPTRAAACSAGRRSRRAVLLAPVDGRRRDPLLVAARRLGRALQPRRHRHARGRPLDGPLSHVPGRLPQERRLRLRHAGREVARVRLPDAAATPAGQRRPRSDRELHGLHRRPCMYQFTAGQDARMDSTPTDDLRARQEYSRRS